MSKAIAAAPEKLSLSPTGVLMAEHRNIEKVLACLERMAEEFEEAGALDAAVAGEALEFLRTYADRLHHAKEETHLFPAMEGHGLQAEVGPTAVMREEHRIGRGFVKDMGDAVARKDLDAFTGAARQYVELLREHIMKEDQVLFPMADSILPAAEQDELRAIFARVESADLGPETLGRMLAASAKLCARYDVTVVPRPAAGGGCGHCCGH
jgi:hemerythrin-like domain-containing protein